MCFERDQIFIQDKAGRRAQQIGKTTRFIAVCLPVVQAMHDSRSEFCYPYVNGKSSLKKREDLETKTGQPTLHKRKKFLVGTGKQNTNNREAKTM